MKKERREGKNQLKNPLCICFRCLAQLTRAYESEYGGFSEAPKFPQPSNFNFLFTYYALNPHLEDAQVRKGVMEWLICCIVWLCYGLVDWCDCFFLFWLIGWLKLLVILLSFFMDWLTDRCDDWLIGVIGWLVWLILFWFWLIGWLKLQVFLLLLGVTLIGCDRLVGVMLLVLILMDWSL